MKRKYIVCILCLVFLFAGGCANRQDKVSYIGAEKAKQLALQDCDLTTTDVDSITTDLSSRNDMDYYQIDFTSGGHDYRYCIDAVTGIVIESQTPAGQQNSSGDTPATSDATAIQGVINTKTTAAAKDTSPAESNLLSVEQAKSKALAHAGLTAEQVTFLEEKLEEEDGVQVYEIEFCTADHKEYDYEIHAYTGDVLSYDFDAENQTDSENSGQTSGSIISEDDVKKLALSRIPGATHSHISKFETHREDGCVVYEGEIIYDDMEYEFEFDAYSGACRSWEAEKHYGHHEELHH